MEYENNPTLHEVFNNPDENPQDPISFPEFLPCNADNMSKVLDEWIEQQKVDNAVQYRKRTSFESKSTFTVLLVCSFKHCGHQVVARIDINKPECWNLYSGTFHTSHLPGDLQTLKKLRLSTGVRNEIIELLGKYDNKRIAEIMQSKYYSGLSCSQLEYMKAHGGISITTRDVWYIRKHFTRQTSGKGEFTI